MSSINTAWEKHVVGGCMEFRPYPVSTQLRPSGISSSCSCGKEEHKHIIPEHDKNPALILNAIKELIRNNWSFTQQGDGLYKAYRGPEHHPIMSVKNVVFEHVIMKAVLKREGIDV